MNGNNDKDLIDHQGQSGEWIGAEHETPANVTQNIYVANMQVNVDEAGVEPEAPSEVIPSDISMSEREIRDMKNSDLDGLLNLHFKGRVVRKDLTKQLKEGANVPVYVLEYLLGMYCASDDDEVVMQGLENVKKSWLRTMSDLMKRRK